MGGAPLAFAVSLFAVRVDPPGPLPILALALGLVEFLFVLLLAGVSVYAALLP